MSKRAGLVAVVAALSLAATSLTVPGGPAAGAPPIAPPGRLAFTDAQEHVGALTMVEYPTDGTPVLEPVSPGSPPYPIEPPQSGQASGAAAPYVRYNPGHTFVSTRPTTAGGPADLDGEVWFDPAAFFEGATEPMLITDDDALQTHPVAWLVNTDCYYEPRRVDIAYASNRSGNWDIWVATLIGGQTDPYTCEPLALAGEPRQITTDPGDDLWPAWSYAHDPPATGPLVRSLVFSSTRSDPRGDLYQVIFDPDGTTPPDPDRLTQLTEGPAADSQPAPRLWVDQSEVQTCPGDPTVGSNPPTRIEPRWLAFARTSEVDPDTGVGDPRGGLALLNLDDPGAGVQRLDVLAASEPAWSPDGGYLAYRSTEADPDGDVMVGRFVRECPQDLAVELTVDPVTVQVDSPVSVSVRVFNTGPQPVSGGVAVLDVTSMLSPPPAPQCGSQVCALSVGPLGPYEEQLFTWLQGDEEALWALKPGTETMTVEVTSNGVDAISANDVDQVVITVETPTPPSSAPPSSAPPIPLAPPSSAPPSSAPPSSAPPIPLATPTAQPVALEVVPRASPQAAPATSPQALPVARDAGPQVVPAMFQAAPAAVAPPVNPPVDDYVYLDVVTVATGRYGVAESHPSFVGSFYPQGTDGSMAVTLMVTERPIQSGISDVVSSDGSDRRRLVDGQVVDEAADDEIAPVYYPAAHPAYSPDGRFMAFHSFGCDRPIASAVGCGEEGSDIVVAHADGTDPQVIYPPGDPRPLGTHDLNPAWSADGTKIAFTRVAPDSDDAPAIWVAEGLDLSGDPVAAGDLVADTVTQVTTPERPFRVEEIDEFDDEAAWSPDGTQIAFTRSRVWLPSDSDSPDPYEGAYDSDIWLVDVASGAEQPLLVTEVGAEPVEDGLCQERSAVPAEEDPGNVCFGGDDRGADWSPDGTKIVYEHTGWLYLADPATRTDLGPLTGPRELDPADDLPLYPDDPPPGTTGPGDPTAATFATLTWAQDPAWSPNGDRIAFSGQPRGQPDLRGIYWLTVPSDPAAREIREIAQQPQPELQPDWQPTADLAVTLTAVPAAILTGAGSVLTAVVTNEGPATARSATVTVTLPAGLTRGTLPAGCAAGPPIVCTLGDLPTGGTATVAIPVVGEVVGVLATSATTSSRTVDPDPADNTTTTSVTVTAPVGPSADVSITLTGLPPAVLVGGQAVLTAVVANAGPTTAQATTVTFTLPVGLTPGALPVGCSVGPPVTCTLGDLPSGATVTLAIPVTGTLPGSLATIAAVSSTTPDPDPADNNATVVITVGPIANLSVEIEIDPNPGYVGGPVEVQVTTSNAGPIDATVQLVLTVPEGSGPDEDEECLTDLGCDLGLIATGAEVVRTITLLPIEALEGPVIGQVTGSILDIDLTNNTAEEPLEVLQPEVLLLPPLGPPGFVTLATGEDFPPGGTVTLTWDPGLNASDDTVEVADDGTFEVAVAVLLRDQLGPRTITATRVKGLEFTPVEVEFLVVPRTQAPPSFEGRG